jgi:hypothetical protein
VNDIVGAGVPNLQLSLADNAPGPCALCTKDMSIGKSYIFEIDNDDEFGAYFGFHDTCFFQVVFVIRAFFNKNGVQMPELMKESRIQ